MNKRLASLLAAVGIALMNTSGWSHGPGLEYRDGRIQIQTPSSLVDGTPIYEDELIFNFVNLGWSIQPPSPGSTPMTVGDTIGLKVLDAAGHLQFSAPTYLIYHNGTTFADPQNSALRILGTTAKVSKTGPTFSDLPLGDVMAGPSFHEHVGLFLDNGMPGVYAMLVANTTTNAAVDDSHPYLMVLNNDLSPEGYAQALADLNAVAIPEASTLVLVGLAVGGAALAAARRNRS